ncbi:hypothetical protein AOCH_001885 [Aspergillus ochraceoroseus]|uniref:Uncharacterized protein n=1 Tax=Aspergillus ochraceoroseus TaxID=138278 RepID=A0A0F8VJG9_9EURO|nr:hypothetical protein AOCH_001885 [Aspergillus ochraceoroseus]
MSPSRRVDELVRQYQMVSYPSPVMQDILNNSMSYSLLVGALRRQVLLVKCRSQEFEANQVTIYDKALLILSKYGEEPMNVGALELYLTEFLGIVPIGAASDGKDMVSNHIELQKVLDEAGRTANTPAEAAATDEQPQRESGREPDRESIVYGDAKDEYNRFHANFHAHGADTTSTAGQERDGHQPDERVERAERILEVYHRAKDDYFSAKERDGVESLRSVRFLRDTAENALRYLHVNGMSGHSCVPDLENVFAMARDRTAQLLGGRKRHFDDDHRRRGYTGYKRPRRFLDSYRPRNHGTR